MRASVARRSVGIPTSGAATVAEARVRAVGTAFLRWRPVIVTPIAVGQAIVLSTSEAPSGQRLGLSLALGAMLSLFVGEAIVVSRRVVTARWLFVSLAATAAGLVAGMALSGGAASPLIVIVLAPLVIAFAAFGRRRATAALLAGVVAGAAAVAALGQAGALPWPTFVEPALGWMRLVAFVGAVALAWTGVAGLAGAYADAARELETLRLAAVEEAASRLRNVAQVSARVAHELKNPLAAVKALAQLEAKDAAARDDGARSARRMGVVSDEIDRMDGLVRDYLAFARPADALAPTRFDGGALVHEVAALASARAAERGVRVVVAGGELVAALVADRARLREALFNLVDNAVRAAPDGSVVEVAHGRDAAGDSHVRVSDRGPGLPAEVVAALARGNTAYVTTRADGTGLGLAIARAALAQHGGRVEFAAREGGGTIATMHLPAQPPSPASPASPAPPSHASPAPPAPAPLASAKDVPS